MKSEVLAPFTCGLGAVFFHWWNSPQTRCCGERIAEQQHKEVFKVTLMMKSAGFTLISSPALSGICHKCFEIFLKHQSQIISEVNLLLRIVI